MFSLTSLGAKQLHNAVIGGTSILMLVLVTLTTLSSVSPDSTTGESFAKAMKLCALVTGILSLLVCNIPTRAVATVVSTHIRLALALGAVLGQTFLLYSPAARNGNVVPVSCAIAERLYTLQVSIFIILMTLSYKSGIVGVVGVSKPLFDGLCDFGNFVHFVITATLFFLPHVSATAAFFAIVDKRFLTMVDVVAICLIAVPLLGTHIYEIFPEWTVRRMPSQTQGRGNDSTVNMGRRQASLHVQGPSISDLSHDKDPVTCLICFEKVPICVAMPCGHLAYCVSCARRQCFGKSGTETKLHGQVKCDLCRQDVIGIKRVHFS